MKVLQSVQPASIARRARRSLVEFTMPATDITITDNVLPVLPTLKARPGRATRRALEHGTVVTAKGKSARSAARRRRERKTDAVASNSEAADTPAKIIADYCFNAFKLTTANVEATLGYAHRVGKLVAPSEFVLLSTMQTRKQVEIMVAQMSALTALSRTLAASTSVKIKRGD